MERFSKFFQQLIYKEIFYVYIQRFHLARNMLLHCLVKFENAKTLPNFHVERDDYYA